MKEAFSMLKDESHGVQEEKTPDYRLISNPFDRPSSVHLRERLASFSIFNDVSRSIDFQMLRYGWYLNSSNKIINR